MGESERVLSLGVPPNVVAPYMLLQRTMRPSACLKGPRAGCCGRGRAACRLAGNLGWLGLADTQRAAPAACMPHFPVVHALRGWPCWMRLPATTTRGRLGRLATWLAAACVADSQPILSRRRAASIPVTVRPGPPTFAGGLACWRMADCCIFGASTLARYSPRKSAEMQTALLRRLRLPLPAAERGR